MQKSSGKIRSDDWEKTKSALKERKLASSLESITVYFEKFILANRIGSDDINIRGVEESTINVKSNLKNTSQSISKDKP